MRDTDIIRTAKGDMTVKEYREFFSNPENICKCKRCPDDEDRRSEWDRTRNILPCGQFHCAVDVACHPERYKW